MSLPGIAFAIEMELSVTMKRTTLVIAFLFAATASVAAQTPTRERRSTDQAPAPNTEQPAVRDRVVGDSRSANHASRDIPTSSPTASPTALKQEVAKPAWGNTALPVKSPSSKQPSVAKTPTARVDPQIRNTTQPKLIKQTSLNVDTASSSMNLRAPAPVTTAVTAVYRVGVGDVLDIRLTNMTTRESTLFTVLKNGVLEYPLLPKPMIVSGLTADEIARRLSAEIKVIRGARASVSVRDYASHAVVITGMVDNPGRKVLRREAMPLFTILAESMPRSEATMATILRNGRETNLSLANSQEMATLVLSGDTIKISGAPKRFVYLGGDIVSAGEKEFRDGMTLTQAVLAAGGALDAKSKIRVARRNAGGFLATEEYSLHAISEGKTADPLVQPGDRIEVRRTVW